ncbi:MAG: hypothetical protein AAF571_09995 [Verrucomicrobiota bacterium]
MNEPSDAIRMAEDIANLLKAHQTDTIVIGAVALAAHHYARFTEDIDLAVLSNLKEMYHIQNALQKAGYAAELHEPDADDPLSGVIDVRNENGHVQIISYADTFPAIIQDSVKQANLTIRDGSPLKIVPLAHLVVLKLYAGGLKSHADIVELLKRNPEVSLQEISHLCNHYQLDGFESIYRELKEI